MGALELCSVFSGAPGALAILLVSLMGGVLLGVGGLALLVGIDGRGLLAVHLARSLRAGGGFALAGGLAVAVCRRNGGRGFAHGVLLILSGRDASLQAKNEPV